ncbi:MAG: hypothetical protein Q8Q31_00420 [Nanoarchaeota archaeon]|nr:hypothetical protein [Nanoarchaeota archaeon]
MERTLIKQGGGGYTIYLPKSWVDKKGLKEGDKIRLQEKDTSLIIQSAVLKKKMTLVVLDNEARSDVRALLTHLYRRGFDAITIENLDEKSFKEIKATLPLLLGFELTDRTANKCTLENLSEPTDQKYDVLLRRLFIIIQETIEILNRDTEKGEFKHLQDITELRDQHDKFVLFCRRILTKEQEERNPALAWELLTFLTHIGHAISYTYLHAASKKVKCGKETKNLVKELQNYFSLYYEAYLRKDENAIHKINSGKEKYHFGKCLEAIKSARGEEAVLLSYIREIYRLIQIGTSPLFSELLIAKEVKDLN